MLTTALLALAVWQCGAMLILLHVNPFSPLSKRSAESLLG